MTFLSCLIVNELMTFLTIIIVFPGFLPPEDMEDWFCHSIMFLLMSFVWPLFLLLFPIGYFILWCCGDLKNYNPYFHEWPFNRKKEHDRNLWWFDSFEWG